MITREKLQEIFDRDESEFFKHHERKIDSSVKAINLLRERIPYDKAFDIITGATYEVVYLVGVEKALEYLTEEDAIMLHDCNVGIHEDNDCLYLNT